MFVVMFWYAKVFFCIFFLFPNQKAMQASKQKKNITKKLGPICEDVNIIKSKTELTVTEIKDQKCIICMGVVDRIESGIWSVSKNIHTFIFLFLFFHFIFILFYFFFFGYGLF